MSVGNQTFQPQYQSSYLRGSIDYCPLEGSTQESSKVLELVFTLIAAIAIDFMFNKDNSIAKFILEKIITVYNRFQTRGIENPSQVDPAAEGGATGIEAAQAVIAAPSFSFSQIKERVEALGKQYFPAANANNFALAGIALYFLYQYSSIGMDLGLFGAGCCLAKKPLINAASQFLTQQRIKHIDEPAADLLGKILDSTTSYLPEQMQRKARVCIEILKNPNSRKPLSRRLIAVDYIARSAMGADPNASLSLIPVAKAAVSSCFTGLSDATFKVFINNVVVPLLRTIWVNTKGSKERELIQRTLNLITPHTLKNEPKKLLLNLVAPFKENALIEGFDISPFLKMVISLKSEEDITLSKDGVKEENNKPLLPLMEAISTEATDTDSSQHWLLELHEFDIKDGEVFTRETNDLSTPKEKIEKEKKIAVETITLKGIYFLFTSLGGVGESFETILEQMTEQNGKLSGNLVESSKLFIDKLNESMRVVGKTNVAAAFTITSVLLPALRHNIVEMGKGGGNKFFDQFKAKVSERFSSDSNNGEGNAHLMNSFSGLFNKVSKSIDSYFSDAAKNPLLTRDEFINNNIDGDFKTKDQSYKDLTNTFVDAFCPKPLHFADTLAKQRAKLSDKLTGPELHGAEKIFMTPLYAVAIAVMWVFEYIFVRWIEWCVNKALVGVIKKTALDTNIVETLVNSTTDAITGKNNGGRGTEITDILLEEVLSLANRAISQELKDDVPAAFAPKLSAEEEKASKELITSFLEVINKYSNPHETTLEQKIRTILKPFTTLGLDISYEKILDLLAPLLYKLYKEITTEEKLDELTALGLSALNKTLQRTEDLTKVTPTQLKERAQEAKERKNRINNQTEILSKQLFSLTKKCILEDFNDISYVDSSNILTSINAQFTTLKTLIIEKLEFIKTNTKDTEKSENLNSLIKEIIHFRDHILKAVSEKESINEDLQKTISELFIKLTALKSLFRVEEIRYHSLNVTDEEKRIISRIKELSTHSDSSIDLKRKLEEIKQDYEELKKKNKHISQIKIMSDLSKTIESIEEKVNREEETSYYRAAFTLLEGTASSQIFEQLRVRYLDLVNNKKPKNMDDSFWKELNILIKSTSQDFNIRKDKMIKNLKNLLDNAIEQERLSSTKKQALLNEIISTANTYESAFVNLKDSIGTNTLRDAEMKTKSTLDEISVLLNKVLPKKANFSLGFKDKASGSLDLFGPLYISQLRKYLKQGADSFPFLLAKGVTGIGLTEVAKIFK